MITSVIFDIDDTLVDHKTAVKNAIVLFHTAYKLQNIISVDELYNVWTEEATRYMEKFFSQEMTMDEQRLTRVRNVFSQIGMDISLTDASHAFLDYLLFYEQSWQLFDDVLDCLNALKDYELGIVSNGGSYQQRNKLDKTDIKHFFPSLVISDDINISKPDVRIFERILKEINATPKQAVYIGDSLKYDIEGAKKANIKGILIDRNGDRDENMDKGKHEEQYITINSLEELPIILKTL